VREGIVCLSVLFRFMILESRSNIGCPYKLKSIRIPLTE
jgi:hypothetical protein